MPTHRVSFSGTTTPYTTSSVQDLNFDLKELLPLNLRDKELEISSDFNLGTSPYNVIFPPLALTSTSTTFNNTPYGSGTYSIYCSNQSAVREFPPAALTSNSTTVSGQTYGNGVYVVSSSFTNSLMYRLFNKTIEDVVLSDFGSYETSDLNPTNAGWYLGTTTTTATSGVSYRGEWVQIQLPLSINPSSIVLTRRLFQNQIASFVLLGSSTGTAWDLLYDQSKTVVVYGSTSNTFSAYTDTSENYRYFRIVVLRVGRDNATCGDRCLMEEFQIFGNIPSTTIFQLMDKVFSPNILTGTTFAFSQYTQNGTYYQYTGYNSYLTTTDSKTGEVSAGDYLLVSLPLKVKVRRVLFNTYYQGSRPIQCVIFGSNDKTTWRRVLNQNTTMVYVGNYNCYLDISDPDFYTYYKVVFTWSAGVSLGFVEFELYGEPETNYGAIVVSSNIPANNYCSVPNSDKYLLGVATPKGTACSSYSKNESIKYPILYSDLPNNPTITVESSGDTFKSYFNYSLNLYFLTK